MLGGSVGLLVGFIYMRLCSGGNFLAVMVGFPCLLGGILAVLLSSNRSAWLEESGARLGKGLLAGFVLGGVYMIVLNVTGAMVRPTYAVGGDYTTRYITMMWRAGPVALGLSSGLFFPLISWAVGLTRVRLLVFEHREPPLTESNREITES